ncbi:hypothetical protein SDC9_157559 [bioreactor metagenome]|uniref:Uncharacterized protein n=1 Tax=bioreactor metagenome TaxID=1076179 RepID=A0A645FCH0_9ZZZZ
MICGTCTNFLIFPPKIGKEKAGSNVSVTPGLIALSLKKGIKIAPTLNNAEAISLAKFYFIATPY